jgi:hypothetical protein
MSGNTTTIPARFPEKVKPYLDITEKLPVGSTERSYSTFAATRLLALPSSKKLFKRAMKIFNETETAVMLREMVPHMRSSVRKYAVEFFCRVIPTLEDKNRQRHFLGILRLYVADTWSLYKVRVSQVLFRFHTAPF